MPDDRRRTRGDDIPAHLPAMNPDKALADWCGKRGLADTGLNSGSESMRRGLDAGILVKDAMRHFWKIANRAFIAFAVKIFVKVPGKISGEIVLGNFR